MGIGLLHERRVEHRRRPVDQVEGAVVVDGGQLGERGQGVVVGGRLDGRGEVGPGSLVDVVHDLGHVDVRVVDVERAHARVGVDPLAIGAHGRMRGVLAVVLGEAASRAATTKLVGQPLDVPLEGADERLIEVVHVEEQVALRRGEEAEVGEVRVAAELDLQAAVAGGRQIGRHGQRGAAVEGRRRDRHPAVPDGDQLRDAGRRLLGDEVDRIGLTVARLPGAMVRQGESRARGHAPGRQCLAIRERWFVGRGRISHGRGLRRGAPLVVGRDDVLDEVVDAIDLASPGRTRSADR